MRFVSWSWRKVLMGVCNVSLIIFDKISTNIFDRKWMWDTQRMSYIYFVSEIFFYDKMDLKIFNFHMTIRKESRAYYRKKLWDTAQCSLPFPPFLQGWSEKFSILAKRGRLALWIFRQGEWFFFRWGGWGFFESIFNKIIIIIMCFTS